MTIPDSSIPEGVQKKKVDALECKIDEKRKIVAFLSDEPNCFHFIFHNDGVKTPIKLTGEAVETMHLLWAELMRREVRRMEEIETGD